MDAAAAIGPDRAAVGLRPAGCRDPGDTILLQEYRLDITLRRHPAAAYRTPNPLHSTDVPSHDRVQDLCDAERIHFVLTGRTHDFKLPSHQTTHTKMGTELRCGTTLGDPPDPVSGNTFLVHEFDLEDQTVGHQVDWTTRVFQRVQSLPVSFSEASSHFYYVGIV